MQAGVGEKALANLILPGHVELLREDDDHQGGRW